MIESAKAEPAPQAPPGLLEEIGWYWQQLPAKPLWISLFVAWLLLFQFLGNSTFGYIDTPSLFAWMNYAYARAVDDQHGYLIPVVVLVLFWWKRRELLAKAGPAWWPALTLVILALALHCVGYMVQQTRVSIFAFFLGLYGLLGLTWGKQFMTGSFFPMVLFIFAVPVATVSTTLTFPLRMLVAKIAVGIGHGLFAMPLSLQGSQITAPDGIYDVAEACSGIRSLTALGAVTMTYAFMGFRTHWKRWVVILAAMPLAVAGNVGRVTTVIILGDVFGQKTAMTVEQYLGMLTFVVALGCLLLLGFWLREPREQ